MLSNIYVLFEDKYSIFNEIKYLNILTLSIFLNSATLPKCIVYIVISQ